jgi:hypothetical protein
VFPGFGSGPSRQDRGMTEEPGLDLHEWQTEMAELQEQLEDSPEEALPDLADLVERIMVERNLLAETGDPVTAEGDDRELIDRYRSGRETATLAEAGSADPGDVAAAIDNLREVFDSLIAERGAP